MSSSPSERSPTPDFEAYLRRVQSFCSTPEWAARYVQLLEKAGLVIGSEFDLVDFGCGTGRGFHLYSTLTMGGRYVGVEHGEMYNFVRWKMASESRCMIAGSMSDVLRRCSYGSFNAVVFSNSLAHTVDPLLILSRAVQLIWDGGRVVVLTNNRWFDYWRWLPNCLKGYKSDPTLKQFFLPSSLRRLMLAAGLVDVEVSFLGDDAIPGLTPESHRYYMMATGYKTCSAARRSS